MTEIKRQDTRDINGHMKCQGFTKRNKPCKNDFFAGWGEVPDHYTCPLHRDQEIEEMR